MEDFTKVTVRHYRFERCDMLEDIAYLKEKEIAFWQVLQPDEVRQALAKDEQVDVESISIISLKTRRTTAGRRCWKDYEQTIIQLWNPLDNQGGKVV